MDNTTSEDGNSATVDALKYATARKRPITIRRQKLSASVDIQLDSKSKLTISHSCPTVCRRPDLNVYLYDLGLKNLRDEWQCIRDAILGGQHYKYLMETVIDLELRKM